MAPVTADSLTGATWNDVGQCYLVPSGNVVNPFTGETKVSQGVVCPKCDPRLFRACERVSGRLPASALTWEERNGIDMLAYPSSKVGAWHRYQLCSSGGGDPPQLSKGAPVHTHTPSPPRAGCGDPPPARRLAKWTRPTATATATPSPQGSQAGPGRSPSPQSAEADPRSPSPVDTGSPTSPTQNGGAAVVSITVDDAAQHPGPSAAAENRIHLYSVRACRSEAAFIVAGANKIGLVREMRRCCRRPGKNFSQNTFGEYLRTAARMDDPRARQKVWRAILVNIHGKEAVVVRNADSEYVRNVQTAVEAVVAEVARHVTTPEGRSAFLTSCFRVFDPDGTGYIRRAAVCFAGTTHDHAARPILRQLFLENPSAHEVDYRTFCVWMTQDPLLLSAFAQQLFACVKPRELQ